MIDECLAGLIDECLARLQDFGRLIVEIGFRDQELRLGSQAGQLLRDTDAAWQFEEIGIGSLNPVDNARPVATIEPVDFSLRESC